MRGRVEMRRVHPAAGHRHGRISQQRRLVRGGHGAGIQRIRAEVGPVVHAGEHRVRRGEQVAQRQAHAVHRRAAHRVGRHVRRGRERHALGPQRLVQRHRAARRAALPVRRGDVHLVPGAGKRLHQRADAGGQISIVVADKQFHAASPSKSRTIVYHTAPQKAIHAGNLFVPCMNDHYPLCPLRAGCPRYGRPATPRRRRGSDRRR